MATYGASSYPNAITVVNTVTFSGYVLNGTYSTASINDAITILTTFTQNINYYDSTRGSTGANTTSLLNSLKSTGTSATALMDAANQITNAFNSLRYTSDAYLYPYSAQAGFYVYGSGPKPYQSGDLSQWSQSQINNISQFLGSFYVNCLTNVTTALQYGYNGQNTVQSATGTTNATDAQSVLKAGIQSTSTMLNTISTIPLINDGNHNTYYDSFRIGYQFDSNNKIYHNLLDLKNQEQ